MLENKIRKTLATGSGIHCLWNPSYFSSITDYDSWEKELLEDEDILRSIKSGNFVPININSDGVFEFEVRVGTSELFQELSKREKKYLTISSEKYRYVSNGLACISGIEYVCSSPDENVGTLAIENGEYEVTVHLIGWDEEPNMINVDGTPKQEALPDFIVIMNPALDGSLYRLDVSTF